MNIKQIQKVTMANYNLIEVKTRSDLRRFLKLPSLIYNHNAYYVYPLYAHIKSMIGNLKNSQKHVLIASQNNQDVARIAFKVHRYKSQTFLHFGFFDCKEGHSQAVEQLISWARNKYPHLSLKGPYHFSMEDPYVGVLVEGFDQMPYFLMPYNFQYYDNYLQNAGLQKAMDLLTYQVTSKNMDIQLASLKSQAQKAKEQGITIRFANVKQFDREARNIAGIFNQALSQNWGFEEFQDHQIREMIRLFKFIIDPRMVAVAVKDGKDIGSLIMLPNYNPIIKPHKGRITPLLIYKYLRRYKFFSSTRGYALGVLKDYHGMGVGSLLAIKMFEQGMKIGYFTGEISWVLANNKVMNHLGQGVSITGKHNKIYRVYEAPALKAPQ